MVLRQQDSVRGEIIPSPAGLASFAPCLANAPNNFERRRAGAIALGLNAKAQFLGNPDGIRCRK